MPQFALHVLLASRVLDARGRADPDPVGRAGENAFLHGAIGPDMGYFPGGDELFSMAAHVVRSGDLVRRLHATAETPEQRAYVAGWVTHVLGDVLIHPIVNRAADALLARDGRAPTAGSRQAAHIRVELGLDAIYAARHRAVRSTRLRPFFDGRTARWIAAAFREVHGVDLGARAVLRGHHQVVRLQRPLLFLERLIAIGRGPRHPFRRIARRLLGGCRRLAERRLGPCSPTPAFLDAVRPSGRVVRTVDELVDGFPAAYEAFASLVLENDVNYSLDVGRIEAPGQPSPEGIEARRRLAARRADQAARSGVVMPASA